MGAMNHFYLQLRTLKPIEFKNLFANDLSQKTEKPGPMSPNFSFGTPGLLNDTSWFYAVEQRMIAKYEEFKHQWSEYVLAK